MIIAILPTMVGSLFVAAAWVVNRIDRFDERLTLQIESIDGRVDELAEDVARIGGRIDKKK